MSKEYFLLPIPFKTIFIFQDKSKLLSQVRAQESVIQGLRMERKLWGEELAQQGIFVFVSCSDHVTLTLCSCNFHVHVIVTFSSGVMFFHECDCPFL